MLILESRFYIQRFLYFRYILNLAAETGAIVVSNDNYRELIMDKPEFKKVIEERILMYSFVNDR